MRSNLPILAILLAAALASSALSAQQQTHELIQCTPLDGPRGYTCFGVDGSEVAAPRRLQELYLAGWRLVGVAPERAGIKERFFFERPVATTP